MMDNLRWSLHIKNKDPKIIKDNTISQHNSLTNKVQIPLPSSLETKAGEIMNQIIAIIVTKAEEKMIMILQEMLEVMSLRIKVFPRSKEDLTIKGRHNQVIRMDQIVIIIMWASKIVEIILIMYMYLWIIIPRIWMLEIIIMSCIKKMEIMLIIWMETALIVSRMGIMQKITINNKENRIAIMEAILLKK